MSPPATSADALLRSVDPVAMRDVDCYLCGSSDRERRFEQDGISLYRCNACGFVYASPQLTDEGLEAIYQDTYWQSDRAKDYGYTDYLRDRALYRRTFEKRIKVLTAHRSSGRLLDVGCAAGFFLDVARDVGFETHGIDVAVPMLAHARDTLGLENIREGTLESAGYPDGAFDVVTMWDVIEHLRDPLTVLREVRRVLADDGLFVLETQNVKSLFARMTGRRWHHYKMLEHLYHFDPRTLTTLLDRAGFEVVRWTSRRAGKYVSMAFIHERASRVGRWLQVALTPLKWLGRTGVYANPHDEMIFVARPKPRSKDG